MQLFQSNGIPSQCFFSNSVNLVKHVPIPEFWSIAQPRAREIFSYTSETGSLNLWLLLDTARAENVAPRLVGGRQGCSWSSPGPMHSRSFHSSCSLRVLRHVITRSWLVQDPNVDRHLSLFPSFSLLVWSQIFRMMLATDESTPGTR